MNSELMESALTIFKASLLILFFAQFIPRKSKRTKKILLIAKISVLIIFIAQSIVGLVYVHYCTDKIQAREQHLVAISKTISPPANAFLKEEYMFRKKFFRMYCSRYTYEQAANEGIKYYKNELSKRGYTIKKLKENELDATNGDILIQIGYFDMQKELTIYIMFDDIFERLSI